ncbi:MAG: Uma2 family endonuclease [Clostridiales bacterium]|nr:Uma2 family endonuclease [Clostridiales bacterium]
MKYTDDDTGMLRHDSAEELMVREALAKYGSTKQQGEYTIEDYYALPDEPRMELIDGVFYAMGAPTLTHQDIAFRLGMLFCNYIEGKGGRCRVYIAPCDVQLDCDNRTMVQPDVMIICDRDKLSNRKNVYGAPDLTVEVLSPSSRRKDIQIKTRKYHEAGVREYWMIDPMKRQIVIHDFTTGLNAIYEFTDKIPVGIFDGNLIVDFEEISRYADEAFGE